MSLHPMANVANEPPGGSHFHVVLDKTFRILIFVDLLEVETIFKGHITGFLNILAEGLTARPRLMPGSIFLDSYIKEPRNLN